MLFRFIPAELSGKSGEIGEKDVWEAICEAFKDQDREGIAFWLYPIFDKIKHIRWEPDILIADRELGLVVIEVKSFGIKKIKTVVGSKWEMVPDFFTPILNPFKQAENQLRVLLDQCKSKLGCEVTGRALVALPMITRSEWEAKGFESNTFCCPPILFKEDLQQNILKRIQDEAIIIGGKKPPLNQKKWNHLLNLLCGVKPPNLQPPVKEPNFPLPATAPRSDLITELQNWVADIDWQQVTIGREIPPGPQRIRGIAGSGKTVLLCQKAARMHWRYPDWDIALVFFTRSLYAPAIELVSEWLRYFSGGELKYDPTTSKLKILHAWGAQNQPGLYSTITAANNISRLLSKPIPHGNPPQRLAFLCQQVLENTQQIQPIFDAILIDEGHDLVVDEEDLKHEDKQAIYWLAWQSLRPIEPEQPNMRRLIWAYDEAQSLDTLTVPTSKQVLGTQLAELIGGKGGTIHQGGIRKAHVMKNCYRIPAPILTAAHALGMGLLRSEGMVSGFTTKIDWQRIGYQVKGSFRPNNQIVLHRLPECSINPAPQYWKGSLIEFKTYDSREEELTALAKKIQFNIQQDKLNPSHDILVVVLGQRQEVKNLETYVARLLMTHGIDIYIPTANSCNILEPNFPNNDPNKFWCEGGVTVSRIHRAKGNEAYMVYVVGLDNVAREESNPALRNQLFVALTRSQAWVNLSGVGVIDKSSFYQEVQKVIASGDTFTFSFKPPLHAIDEV